MSFSLAYSNELLDAEDDPMALEQLRQEFDGRMRELEGQINKLTLAVEGYRGNQEQTLMILQRIVNRHDELLNGFHDQPGLVVRADRLEQSEKVRTWNLRAIWVAILGGAVKVIMDMVRRG